MRSDSFNLFLSDFLTLVCVQIPDNYTPPAPITAPVMGFPAEGPQPHDHAQVPPGAPQEPSMQVSTTTAVCVDLHQRIAEQGARMWFLVRSRFLQLLQQLPTERVEQKEIPAEHMILKSTFDSLVQRCQLAARDPVSLSRASVFTNKHEIHLVNKRKP